MCQAMSGMDGSLFGSKDPAKQFVDAESGFPAFSASLQSSLKFQRTSF
jgi:hypothetical protein